MTDTAAPATTQAIAASARRRRRTPDLVWTAAIGVVALCYLQWGPRPEAMSTRVVPDPASVAAALADAASGGALWPHLWSTLVATLGGFLVATVAAVFLAALLVALPRLERILTPYIVGFQSLPKIAVAPLVILWLGFGNTSKIAVVAFLAFFPIFVNCLQGFRIRDRVRYELFLSLGATPLELPALLVLAIVGLTLHFLMRAIERSTTAWAAEVTTPTSL